MHDDTQITINRETSPEPKINSANTSDNEEEVKIGRQRSTFATQIEISDVPAHIK